MSHPVPALASTRRRGREGAPRRPGRPGPRRGRGPCRPPPAATDPSPSGGRSPSHCSGTAGLPRRRRNARGRSDTATPGRSRGAARAAAPSPPRTPRGAVRRPQSPSKTRPRPKAPPRPAAPRRTTRQRPQPTFGPRRAAAGPSSPSPSSRRGWARGDPESVVDGESSGLSRLGKAKTTPPILHSASAPAGANRTQAGAPWYSKQFPASGHFRDPKNESSRERESFADALLRAGASPPGEGSSLSP